MQKKNRRDFFIAGTKGYVEWNMIGNKFKLINYNNGIEEVLADPGYTNDAMFISQAKYFLKQFERSDNKYYLELTKYSLEIVRCAKLAMETGCKVKTLKK